ncbi:MAG: hypothetical protein HYT75_05260 [Deltaproteobacteria bacterium]|nr:hypothetical protein [Deltaproteobacteria bacterium]
MKIRHLIYPAIYLALIGHAWAVCPTFTPTTAASIKDVKTILENYNCYLDSNSNEYVLDFSKNSYNNSEKFQPYTKYPLAINNTSYKLVRIIGLKLNYYEGKEAVSPYITFSGSKITLQDSTLTGIGIGTAIQVNGSATIESTAISNFAEGIKVAKDASVKLAKNAFTIADPANAVVFDSPVQIIDESWIGKHVSESDATKADKLAGKLALEASKCSGSVGLYQYDYEQKTEKGIASVLFIKTCALSLDSTDEKSPFKLKLKDNTEKEIPDGSCYFDCIDLGMPIQNFAGFAYTDANSQTKQFLFASGIITDLPDVINTPSLPIYLPTTSGADGTTTASSGVIFVPGVANSGGEQVAEVPIYLPTTSGADGTTTASSGVIFVPGVADSGGGQVAEGSDEVAVGEAVMDPSALPPSSDDDNENNDNNNLAPDSGAGKASAADTLGQGQGACSLIKMPQTNVSHILWLLLAFGGLPVIGMRFNKLISQKLSLRSR